MENAVYTCRCGSVYTSIVAFAMHHVARHSKRKTININYVYPENDITGQHFNRLTPVFFVGKSEYEIRSRHFIERQPIWLCKCDCGNYSLVSQCDIMHSRIKSCGCIRQEKRNLTGVRQPRIFNPDSDPKDRIYRIWNRMKYRCYKPSYVNYKHFGGRGIKICDEWLGDSIHSDGFKSFYEWSLQNGYAYNLEICRRDYDGDFKPENCLYTTKVESFRYIPGRDGKFKNDEGAAL